MKLILTRINLTLIQMNNFIENCLQIFQVNHQSSISLLAFALLSCVHFCQLHLFVFLLTVIAVLFDDIGRQRIIILLSFYVLLSCISVQMVSLFGVVRDQQKNETNKTIPEDSFTSEPENEEIKLLILHYIFTLVNTFSNSAMQLVNNIMYGKVLVLFTSVSRRDADKGILKLAQYLLNFVFYKFGLEICLMGLVLQITLDVNPLDVILLVWLFLTVVSRKTARKCWKLLRGSLIIIIILKYIFKVNNQLFSIIYAKSLFDIWKFLPFEVYGHSKLENHITNSEIIWNFAVLLMVHRQEWVFQVPSLFPAGSNKDVWQEFGDAIRNTVPDFMIRQRNMLDSLKKFFFPIAPWIAMGTILSSSVYSWNAYSIGYILISGTLLWYDSQLLYMKPMSYTLRRWKVLMLYTCFVIISKYTTIVLQYQIIPMLLTEPHVCYRWMLISLRCPKTLSEVTDYFEELSDSLRLDVLYMGILLFIRRLICSRYFLHLKNEICVRDFLDEWGPALLHKATVEMLNEKHIIMERLKVTVECRGENLVQSRRPPGMFQESNGADFLFSNTTNTNSKSKAQSLDEWFRSTTLAYRFTEFGLNEQAKKIKEEQIFFEPMKKKTPTKDDLENLWKCFLKNEKELKSNWFKVIIASWQCLRTHSQILCFMLIFSLQCFQYKSSYTMILPLSVLYASWWHPRPPTWYWNVLCVVMLAMVILKSKFFWPFFENIPELRNNIGENPPIIEILLILAIVWHRSILHSLGLWYHSLSETPAPERVATVDVYIGMVLLEAVNFLIVFIGFSTFGDEQGDGGVVEYASKSNVPISLLVVFLLHGLCIALDRVLYISSAFRCRAFYHATIFCTVHWWLFIYVPATTERPFGFYDEQNIYYLLKCMYLLLSAYQVRLKHSRSSAVSILCQGYGTANYVLFLIYSKTPFIEPIRRMLDFFFTKTFLTREEFVIVESIYEKIFEVKCERKIELHLLTNRQKRVKAKAVIGLAAILSTFLFLSSPMIYFIADEYLSQKNPIDHVKIAIHGGILGEIYWQEVDKNALELFTKKEWNTLYNMYNTSKRAKTFLDDFSYHDVTVVRLPKVSMIPWSTSSTREYLASALMNVSQVMFEFQWEIRRKFPGQNDYGYMTTYLYKPNNSNSYNYALAQLAEMTKEDPDKLFMLPAVAIEKLMPKYILLLRSERSEVIAQLSSDQLSSQHTALVKLIKTPGEEHSLVWKVMEDCEGKEYQDHISRLPKEREACDTMEIYVFSDHPPLLNFVSGIGGLIGLYAGVILSIWAVFAKVWTRQVEEIMFEEMDSVDSLIQLCIDIYQCRITGQIELELELAKKLISIFCNPTELEKWTKNENDPRH